MLPDHYAAHEDGDIEKTLSEINIEIVERDSISPHPPEKSTQQQNMQSKAPAVPLVTYSRLSKSKQVSTRKIKRQSDTKSVVTPGAKRQKRKDNTQLIVDSSTLQQQPKPLMVLPSSAPSATNKQSESKKENK